ncbi:class D beta-lactamase [Pedobacter antarcticus]|uniref:class D beta-lactamase n=1 Tax=Pedobacter antarcticus TaxID=34086 RepID=UPI00292D232A|nr:class D beta-lactamase [Pedobacter antarcticus]
MKSISLTSKRTFLLILLISALLSSIYSTGQTKTGPELQKFYDQYKVEGSFILYDQKNEKYTIYNEGQSNTLFTPASTFKICNSLISLEEGVIENESIVLEWDKKPRQNPEWNADTDMKNAFKNSTVWFYQELAKRVGEKRMQYWLKKAAYGNADISGGINGFWLWGGLRISPLQQIEFLKRLNDNDLPFSVCSIDIVKRIMIVQDHSGSTVRAKTGSGKQNDEYVGWYVGYITTANNVYYFSNCIQSKDKIPNFGPARTEIAYNILNELGILKK